MLSLLLLLFNFGIRCVLSSIKENVGASNLGHGFMNTHFLCTNIIWAIDRPKSIRQAICLFFFFVFHAMEMIIMKIFIQYLIWTWNVTPIALDAVDGNSESKSYHVIFYSIGIVIFLFLYFHNFLFSMMKDEKCIQRSYFIVCALDIYIFYTLNSYSVPFE